MTDPAARRYAAVTTADAAGGVVFAAAAGCELTDTAGRRYIDFIAGYGVGNAGWQRPEVLAAMADQMRAGCFAPPWLPTRPAVELAEALLAVAPPGEWACGRATGGAEANEVAGRAHTAARGGTLLVVGRAYHGGTARTLGQSDGPAFRLPPAPPPAPPRVPPAYCYRCPYGKTFPGCSLECAEAIETAAAADPAITGVLLEPALGSGGAVVPPQAYFDAVQDICRRRNLTLILDEVMTGCGRLGAFFAADLFGITPNAITLAKGLGGGYVPVGAALLDADLADAARRYEDVSATCAWTPLACAAAVANLRLIRDENLPARAAETGATLLAELRALFDRRLPAHTGEVRGRGLLIGIELVEDRVTKRPAPRLAQRIALRCLRGGLMVGTSWDWSTLLVMPPLTLDADTMSRALDILDRAVTAAARGADG